MFRIKKKPAETKDAPSKRGTSQTAASEAGSLPNTNAAANQPTSGRAAGSDSKQEVSSSAERKADAPSIDRAAPGESKTPPARFKKTQRPFLKRFLPDNRLEEARRLARKSGRLATTPPARPRSLLEPSAHQVAVDKEAKILESIAVCLARTCHKSENHGYWDLKKSYSEFTAKYPSAFNVAHLDDLHDRLNNPGYLAESIGRKNSADGLETSILWALRHAKKESVHDIEAYIMMVTLLARYTQAAKQPLSVFNIHRLMSIALLLANKYLLDNNQAARNIDFYEIYPGFFSTLQQLNSLERIFLEAIDYKVSLSPQQKLQTEVLIQKSAQGAPSFEFIYQYEKSRLGLAAHPADPLEASKAKQRGPGGHNK